MIPKYSSTFLLLLLLNSIQGARILVLLLVGSKSHRAAYDPLFLKLASRGHQITHVSNPYMPGRITENVREITGPNISRIFTEKFDPFQDNLDGKDLDYITICGTHAPPICKAYFEMPAFLDLLSEKFELVMIDASANECAFGFLHYFQVPYVLFSALPLLNHISLHLGVPSIPSGTPVMLSALDEEMTFLERTQNFYNYVTTTFWRKRVFYSENEEMYRRLLPGAPSIEEIYQNATLVLQNSHRSMDPPLVTVPGIISIGGMHCREAQPLPKELKTYLDKGGFIYFSLGAFVAGTQMPPEIRQEFLGAFARLKERVLWKYESEIDPAEVPENVRLMSWVPQQDVLAHPNAKLFITHGGIMSSQEAIYHAVPILGIPIWFDQRRNINRLVKHGMGLKLELRDLTRESLLENINRILKDPSFSTAAKMKSEEFRDEPMKPVDVGVYWIEHVLRHGKQLNLFPLARRFNIIKYYSIDVLLFLVAVIVVGLVLILKCFQFIWNKLQTDRVVQVRDEPTAQPETKKVN